MWQNTSTRMTRSGSTRACGSPNCSSRRTARMATCISASSTPPASSWSTTTRISLHWASSVAVPSSSQAKTVGRVEIEASLRELLGGTGVAAVFSMLLGFGVYFAVRVFPLRVLDQTLGALRATNLRFEAAINNMPLACACSTPTTGSSSATLAMPRVWLGGTVVAGRDIEDGPDGGFRAVLRQAIHLGIASVADDEPVCRRRTCTSRAACC